MLYNPKWNLTPQERNRLELAGLLRDRSRWPRDFKWRYTNCGQCAMGVLYESLGKPDGILMLSSHAIRDEGSWLRQHLGLDEETASLIFWEGGIEKTQYKRLVLETFRGAFDLRVTPLTLRLSQVTPEDIAALLEATVVVVEHV